MEVNTQRRAAGLKDKIPDIEKTLDTVRFLKTRKVCLNKKQCSHNVHLMYFQPGSDPIKTTFELNDTLYAKAEIPPTEEVFLWLGANVMLSYPISEAETLLEGRLNTAQTSLGNCEEDLDFLREQITVSLRRCVSMHDFGRLLIFGTRPWRWLRRECTIGVSRRRGKRRVRRARRKRRGRSRHRMDDDEGVSLAL